MRGAGGVEAADELGVVQLGRPADPQCLRGRWTAAQADDTRRDALYRRLQAILHDRGGFLIWGEADWIVASAPQVGGIATAPANSLDWARFDTVWLG